MSIISKNSHYGPRTITNGLVLALDAGNSKGFDDDENLMTNSQLGTTILNDGGGVTLTTDTTIVNPFGVYDGVLKCVHTTDTPGYFRRGQNMSLTAGVTYTFSFFFKNGTVVSPYGQSSLSFGITVTTLSPTFQELSQSLNTTISFSNGWYRQVFTFTPAYTQTYQVDFNQTVNQTPRGTYYLYGFQLERGSPASPYYATTSTAKNRGTTLIDMTGRGNSGTLTNGPTYSSANGGSLVFDGVNDYVSGSIPTINSWSMCLWYLSTDITSKAVFYPFSGTTSTNGLGFGGTFSVDTVNRWYFFDGTTVMSGSNTAVTTNVWYNLVVTKTSTTYNLYTNGSLSLNTSGVDLSLTQYNLGRRGSLVDNWYSKGNIAQASIYNRALSATEIQQNFNATRSRYSV